MRRLLAISLFALISGASLTWAQQAQPDLEFRPSTLRMPEFDTGDRIVVIGMVPIPDVGEGAPLFTSRDLTEMKEAARKTMSDAESDTRHCGIGLRMLVGQFDPHEQTPSLRNLLAQEFEAARKVSTMADRAAKTTAQAEAARRDAAAGDVEMKEVEARELDRQEAINFLQMARADLVEAQAMIGDFQDISLNHRNPDWPDLRMRQQQRKKDRVGLGVAVPDEHKGLDIQNVIASQHKDKKGKDMVVVRGEIVNASAKSASIPDLFVALVDEKGWPLTNTTVSPPWTRKGIGPGKTKSFAVEVRPAPELLKTAVVTFAPKHAPEPRMGVGYFCSQARAMFESSANRF